MLEKDALHRVGEAGSREVHDLAIGPATASEVSLNKSALALLYRVEAFGRRQKPQAGRVMNRVEWIRSALDRYEKPLLRYASRIIGNPEAARDVVQEAFLRLCKADPKNLDGRLAAWLYTVTRNCALNMRKQAGSTQSLREEEAAALPSPHPSPGAVAACNETDQLVLAILDTLSETQQEAFRLKFRDDLSYREIQQIMGVSLGTVSNLVTSALQAIRQRLDADGDPAQEV